MSRPGNPSWLVGSWANTDLYPPGTNPWNSNPTKTVPSGTYFTPGQGAAAPIANYLFNQIYTAQAAEKAHAQALTNFVGQSPALTFGASISCADAPKLLAYQASTKTWFVAGTVAKFRRSTSPYVFPAASETLPAVTYSLGVDDVAFSATRILIAHTTGGVHNEFHYYNGASWSILTDSLGSAAIERCALVFAGTRWLLANVNSSLINYSAEATPATWSSVANPCSTGTGVYKFCRVGTRTVLLGVGNLVKFSYTDNESTSWAAATTVTPSQTSDYASLVHNGTYYMAIAGGIVGSNSSNVYTSTDGVTWTQTGTPAMSIRSLAAIGELWAGLDETNTIAFSADRGATWRRADFKFPAAGTIASNGTRFIVTEPTNNRVWVGAGVGTGV